ncbi:hypothetical protein SteCoe_29855 [Stentor coeruleus]|uniref:Uncharacterized protein n=1 Tax=Stentor coeruleus TaxID=5963 RepID=A0A1R2B598_9CILI|nr:hypothetical protein SteCoe_29855 [Stentor coeruleus]
MLPKRLTARPSKVIIFHNKDQNFPTIQLLQPSISSELSNSFIKFSEQQTRNQKVIDNYGLLNVCHSPCLNSSPITIRNSGSKICMADFLGEKNAKQLISAKKLLPLRRNLKKKIFLKEVQEKSSLFRPTTPVIMDQNIKLRLALDKSKRKPESRIRRRRGTKSLSYAPSLEILTSDSMDKIYS